MNQDSSAPADGLRELAFFMISSACLYGTDTAFFPSAGSVDGEFDAASRWPFRAACAFWLVLLGSLGWYLV